MQQPWNAMVLCNLVRAAVGFIFELGAPIMLAIIMLAMIMPAPCKNGAPIVCICVWLLAPNKLKANSEHRTANRELANVSTREPTTTNNKTANY